MKNPKTTEKIGSPSSSTLTLIIRNSLITYLLSAVTVPAICFIFGWRSLDTIGTGFLYGSMGLTLFGALMLAGNTVPAQLSRLSIPKYRAPSLRRHQEGENDGFARKDGGTGFFFTTLICGALLFVTGLLLKLLW